MANAKNKLSKAEQKEFKKMLAAEVKAAKATLAANHPTKTKSGRKAAKAAKKTAKKAASRKTAPKKKKGKLTVAGRKRIAAASRARWRARKGAGRQGKRTKSNKGHIPLAVLKNNHRNLGKLIANREGKSGWS